jgi:hypothetical protein
MLTTRTYKLQVSAGFVWGHVTIGILPSKLRVEMPIEAKHTYVSLSMDGRFAGPASLRPDRQI